MRIEKFVFEMGVLALHLLDNYPQNLVVQIWGLRELIQDTRWDNRAPVPGPIPEMERMPQNHHHYS